MVAFVIVAETCDMSGNKMGVILCGVALILICAAALLLYARDYAYVVREPTVFDSLHEEYGYLED